jgi:hypothetical protein
VRTRKVDVVCRHGGRVCDPSGVVWTDSLTAPRRRRRVVRRRRVLRRRGRVVRRRRGRRRGRRGYGGGDAEQ